MVKVGVCLSGCGVFDGSEITEAVCTLLALDRAGAQVVCMAPDMELDVIDHVTQKATGEKRNVLIESARIARGEIEDIAKVKASDLDALIFPGGFGAAKNLCDFAAAGADGKIHPEVARLAWEVHQAGKPLGAICIAPALMALLFKGREEGVKLTIGTDEGTAKVLESLGAVHENHPPEEICVDEKHKVVTTPAYMLAQGPAQVWAGIERLVQAVLSMAG
ncbi:MAG TPA: isoprenoid biosynthesis glyoxalase ElbB [Planctomycetes bacterium]|nr:isoprenoid biosynthesis glyoxalase ElbB [Planctomycetota bacterium]